MGNTMDYVTGINNPVKLNNPRSGNLHIQRRENCVLNSRTDHNR